MSNDQMQDVYPIQFEFKKGELPTAQKLTALVKHVDSAFSSVTQAVGDPWDYQSHSIGKLSLEYLSQTSLARLIGPSDWLSPGGTCWNESQAAPITVYLNQNKNSWTLGFPLVKVTTPIEEVSTISGTITPLTWGAGGDITVAYDPAGVLTGSPKASLDLVVADGDFYVDFYKGTITAYSSPQFDIRITVDNLHMLGAGVPWGTHNVIPTWRSASGLCNVAKVTDFGDQTRYTLTLPTVGSTQRVGTYSPTLGNRNYASGDYDTAWSVSCPGTGATYRLPPALTTAGLSAGTTIPGGYLGLWDETQARLIPLVTFKYRDENSLTLETPTDWLTLGDNYRLILSGTSISEAVSYLMELARYGAGNGLAETPTISYSMPISHDSLENRFAGNLTFGSSDNFKFRESSYQTNPHPQYLHRYGYMPLDADGNSANAMRGELVFTNTEADDPSLAASIEYSSVGISFGTYLYNRIRWGGAESDTPGTLGVAGEAASRYGFHFTETAANPWAEPSGVFGALEVSPAGGAPLYIRGRSGGNFTFPDYRGAVIGFDLGTRAEMNYVKLMAADRDGTLDIANKPANTNQTGWGSALDITSVGLINKLSPEQIREWRFRGVPNVENATSTTGSVGQIEGDNEFLYYFTSPGMVGADFFNVYSNAIFFSDTGSGATTSFTDNATNWLHNGLTAYRPSSINYIPGSTGRYTFVCYEGVASSRTPMAVGYSYGFTYLGTGDIHIATTGTTKTMKLYTTAAEPASLANRTIQIESATHVYTNASAGNNTMQASGVAWLFGGTDAWISSGTALPSHNSSNTYNTIIKSDASDGTIQILTAATAPIVPVSTDIVIKAGHDIYLSVANDIIFSKNTGSGNFEFWGIDSGTGTDLIYDGGLKLKSSSARYKENIEDAGDVNWVLDLNVRRFNYKTQPGIINYGFIAEEVNEINPDVVFLNKEGIIESVKYDDVFSALLKLVQNQQKEIDELKNKIGQ